MGIKNVLRIMSRGCLFFLLVNTTLSVTVYAGLQNQHSTPINILIAYSEITDSLKNDAAKFISPESENDILIEDENEELILSPAKKKEAISKSLKLEKRDDSTRVNQTDTLRDVNNASARLGDSAIPDSTKMSDMRNSTDSIALQPDSQIVEIPKSINFANNLDQYRSPQKAMFLSLLLPGLGQSYAKSTLKTVAFGLIDAILIGFAVKYSLDGKDTKRKAEKIADAHFHFATRFLPFYDTLYNFIYKIKDADTTVIKPEDSTKMVMNALFGQMSREELVSYQNNQTEIYKFALDSFSFVQGWDDCTPAFTSNGYIIADTALYKINKKEPWYVYMSSGIITGDTTRLGFSLLQRQYNTKVLESNNLYRMSRNFLFIIIANHIASAIDAFITARSFNNELLEKESVWNHINIDQDYTFYQGHGLQTRIGISYRF